MSTTRMRLGALVTAGALTVALSACGGEDDTTDSPTPPAATENGTADEAADDATGTDEAGDTDVAAGTDDAGGTAVGEGEEISVEEFMALLQEPGEETLSRYRMSMEMDMDESGAGLDGAGATGAPGAGQMTMEGAVDLSGDSPRMQITMNIPQMGTVDVLFVDGTAYMAMPGLTEEGTYLEAPPEVLGDAADLGEVDVSAQWETWEKGAQEVLLMGEEDVDGEQMRRYQVTVDPQVVAEAMAEAEGGDAAAATTGPALEEGGDAAAATTGPALEEPVVYDVWLDEDNLMRKMVFDVEGDSIEMRMHDWGEDPDIQAPEEDQIVDMNDLGTGPTG